MYRDALATRDLSHARLTERCFVLQHYSKKRFSLKAGKFQHVFRMPEPDGTIVASCDCSVYRGTMQCIHVEFVKRFGLEMMPEPLHHEEDPDSCLVSLQNRKLFFSVSTKTSSATRHSQKRIIVEYFIDKSRWRCRSCPKGTM